MNKVIPDNKSIDERSRNIKPWTVNDKHFLQTKPWFDFQLELGNKVVKHDDFNGIIEKERIGSRLYIPYVVVGDTNLSKFTKNTMILAAQNSLDYVRADIIPASNVDSQQLEKELIHLGWRKAPNAQPKDSAISIVTDDLTDLQTDIQFRKSNNPKDIKVFLNLLHSIPERTGTQAHSDSYFRTLASALFPSGVAGMFIASIPNDNDDESENSKDIATIIYFVDDTTIYITYIASLGLKYNRPDADNEIALYAQIEASKMKKNYLDWCEMVPKIAPENYSNEEYLGTWELPVNKITARAKYWLYNLLRSKLG